VLQASVAEAVPRAPSIADEDGLQPKAPFAGVPVVVMVGAVTSTIHVAVLAVVAVLPQPSIAVQVLVCERLHPLVETAPSVCVTVGVAQASVAVAVPKAASIADVDGLQLKAPFAGVPVAVIVGGTLSVQTFIAKGGIKSFNSAVVAAEDFVFIKMDVKGSPRQGVEIPAPNKAVMSMAPSTNCNESVYTFCPKAPLKPGKGVGCVLLD